MKATSVVIVVQYGLMDGFNPPQSGDWIDFATFPRYHVGEAEAALKRVKSDYENRPFQSPTMFRIIERVTTIEETVIPAPTDQATEVEK